VSVLVVDAGTTSVRAALVRPDGTVTGEHRRPLAVSSPNPGFVEFDPLALAQAALEVAELASDGCADVRAVGIANQRASTVVWDRASGEPVGPGIGWQDLRTVPMCLALREQGVRVAPNASATKLALLLDMADPGRKRDLCFGTVDTWLAWTLSSGALHVTDATNAGVTGLMALDGSGWDQKVLDALRIPETVLPRIVDTSGILGPALALSCMPTLAALAGDQQASLVGQGCTRPGLAKATFGTGGMLDLCVGPERPAFPVRGEAGCFPVIAWRRGGVDAWGVEAVMLTAGTAVEWLRQDLGLLERPEDSAALAAAAQPVGDVWFVPALHGLGSPAWDFGARGTLIGVTPGVGRAELARAVLEGVAHRGADLVEAAEADAATTIPSLRVDGGMAANPFFVQALADACQRPVELAPVREATTLGAGYLAGMAVGLWAGEDEVAEAWAPRQIVEPRRKPDRDRWRDAVARATRAVPELSALDF
jgi:glycerol kinase